MVMEWMATITGDHVGYPGFWDLGDFSPRRKILGSQKFARLLALNFCNSEEDCLQLSTMEQRTLKKVNNYLNTNIYSYLETSGGQSSNPYLNVVHFVHTSVN